MTQPLQLMQPMQVMMPMHFSQNVYMPDTPNTLQEPPEALNASLVGQQTDDIEGAASLPNDDNGNAGEYIQYLSAVKACGG